MDINHDTADGNPTTKLNEIHLQLNDDGVRRASLPIVETEKKNNRRAPISDISVEPAEGNRVVIPLTPKSESSFSIIKKALKGHFLFSILDRNDIQGIVGVMENSKFETGDFIIKQGSQGSSFYVLESGECDIIVNNQVVGKYTTGNAFGELALMYNCPRAASIQATSQCNVWSVNRTTFRKILATTASIAQVARVDFLRNVSLLQRLSNNQIQKVAAALKMKQFCDGEYIIREGEEGNTFYIIMEGKVRCTAKDSKNSAKDKDLMTLSRGDYFGEMALMLNEPRQANCISHGKVVCLMLDRKEFTNLLGPLRDLLDRQMRIRVLRSVPLLSSLSDDELDILAHALRVVAFKDGEQIIKEGDVGDIFYMISDGSVNVKKCGIDVMKLNSGEFFGERALLQNEPRAADCWASGKVECLILHRNSFEKLLGKLEHIMQREIKRQKQLQHAAFQRASSFQEHSSVEESIKVYEFHNLKKIATIGTGTFGRVLLVNDKKSGNSFALKCMQKINIVSSHQQRNVMHEKNIISECEHPFILKLYETYADTNQLYMLLELVQGGELWSLLYEKSHLVPAGICSGFSREAGMFYSGCVVSCLQYLQRLGVAYRDLKPENLILDSTGYLKVVDFGFAKHIPYYKGSARCDRSFTLCGTPEYLSPELVLSKGHSKAVDYWALGCLIYELLIGKTPFQDPEQQKIFENIIHTEKSLVFPKDFNPLARDLVVKLLHPNPALRLGSLAGGVNDIMNHPWFQECGFDWQGLYSKKLTAPYIPEVKNAFDTSNFDPYPEEVVIEKYTGPDYFQGF